MKEVVFSHLVLQKLRRLKSEIIRDYGERTASSVLKKITNSAEGLGKTPQIGVNIRERYGIDTDYWYLFTCHQYLVYRIEPEEVTIVQMFHERQDFMKKLFGVSGRTQASIDYWGE